MLRRTKSIVSSGLSLIELMIAVTLLSAVAIYATRFLKQNNSTLSESDSFQELRTSYERIRGKIDADLKQAVALNPSCDDNQADAFLDGDCEELLVRGGVTPLPDADKDAISAMSSFAPPANLSDDPAGFTGSNDGIRILQYDFTGTFNCRLNPRHTATANPSTSENALFAHPQCSSLLEVGGAYIISEEIGGVVFSNVFQITAMSTSTLIDGTSDIRVEFSAGLGNRWNQPDSLGEAGYSTLARIYPVKLVEYAIDADNGGLYRREFTPSSGDFVGATDWALVEPNVESLQLTYILGNSTSGTAVSQRGIIFGADDWQDGLEDVFGVTPRLIMKSNHHSNNPDSVQTDNPLTASVEADQLFRQDLSFYAPLRNRE